jgi:proline iminopeptidase
MEFRRSLPPAPKLSKFTVESRGLPFAVFTTPPVSDSVPLVCVNGGLMYSHRLLWPALAPLARERQLIFYDQRGRGETPAPPAARSARIEHDAGDLVALRTALGHNQWDVLGHSWGGGIALLACSEDPSAVRRLVLVDAVGPTSEWLPKLHDAALERLDTDQRNILERAATAGTIDGSSDDPEAHAAYSRAMYPAWFADQEFSSTFSPPRSSSVAGAAIAARLRRDGYDWRDRLRALDADVLVIHGEEDLLPPAVARELAGLLPRARLELIPGAGHMPFWEAPAQFFSLVSAFLSEPGTGHHEAT